MRIVFMGTPAFALPTLRKLLDQRFEVVGVYTRPDRPSGRGQEPAISPVKALSQQYQLPVFQPTSFRQPEILEELRRLAPDVIVVAAYGRILPPAVLDLPRHGCLNVHPSLLPKYRGPSPIVAAILEGDEETGVSIMKVDTGTDTGPLVAQVKVSIEPDDTSEVLSEKLAQTAAELLSEVLPLWIEGKLQPQPQDERRASYSHLIEKDEGALDWTLSAERLCRQVRAFNPWPSAFTYFRGKMLKVLEAYPMSSREGLPGRAIPLGQNKAGVVCGEGVLELRKVQLEGRRPMPVQEFLRGQRDFIGTTLEDTP